MNCEEALALISAGLDGALSPAEAQALEAHLANCPDCAALARTLEGLEEKLPTLAEPAPEGLKKGVMYRIDQATGKAKPPRRGWFGPGTALGAVAAVLVLLVGLKVIPLQRTMNALSSMENAAPVQYAPQPAETAQLDAPATDISGHENRFNSWQSVKGSDKNFPASEDFAGPQTEVGEGIDKPAAESLWDECAALSREEDAMVLLYTEFSPESLFGLLETEAAPLYALTEEMPNAEENRLLRYETDCGTALAIQEWLVNNLPDSDSLDPVQISAEGQIKTQMEALDPGSSNLYRIIRVSQVREPIVWPESWPSDWADRLRTQENWALFYPAEDFVPQPDAPALLVFPAG